MVNVERFTPEQVIKALHGTKGLLSHTARRLKCSTNTVKRYIRDYPQVREAWEDARYAYVDLAELRMYEAVDRGEPWAVMGVLKGPGKSRGYAERHEQTGPAGGPIQHDIGPLPLKEIILEVPALSDGDGNATDERATIDADVVEMDVPAADPPGEPMGQTIEGIAHVVDDP